jgi:glycosyltransferase involved in cell wall biosynthesis
LYCIDYDKLSSDEQSLISLDTQYQSKNSVYVDAAYQAFQKGIIEDATHALENQSIITDVSDNYRFVKKYFHPFWVYYIFLIRIISLKNPLKEIKGIAKSLSVHKLNLFEKIYNHDRFNSFHSALLEKQPIVSVIIPTLNRYDYLNDVLLDFEKQTYSSFTIIVIDQSDDFNPTFYDKYKLDIQLIRQDEKALWLARNTGIEHASTNLIAFSEDDVRIPIDWLKNHLKCLDYYQCDISNGVFFPEGKDVPTSKKMFKYAEQFATGNACMYKSVFYKTGLFDRQFEKMRAGDGEYGLRCYLNGFTAISNPLAFCEDLKASTGGLRHVGSWDWWRSKSLLSPRPIPSVLYFIRKYFGNENSVIFIINNVIPSFVPYKYKGSKMAIIPLIFIVIFLFPLFLYPVFLSWKKSTLMLSKGSDIKYLKILK